MTQTAFATSFENLPREVPVFPLSGVLLLPMATLPLNIFEPRYMAMIEDALGAGRIIALAQPLQPSDDPSPLYSVGCLGRIVSFMETSLERFEISLLGLCRVRLLDEVDGKAGYRRFKADYDEFEVDGTPPPKVLFSEADDFFTVLNAYADTHGFSFDWEMLRSIPHGNLVNALSMACPFDPREKQALLEAPTPQDRANLLHNLLQISLVPSLSSESTQ